MSFPTNSLPAEFEAEHGSVDLLANDQPQEDSDDGEDEDLELGKAGQGVWLCKIPKFLMEKWNTVQEEGVELGRIRVYEELDAEGHNKVALLLPEHGQDLKPVASTSRRGMDIKGKGPAGRIGAGAGRPVPTEYKLSMTNRASKNLFVFGEKEEDVEDTGEEGHRKRRRITSMLGTVHHECGLTPQLSNSYSEIMRERLRKASEPTRKLKKLDVDEGTANRLASGVGLGGVKQRVSTFVKAKPVASAASRTARMPRNELLDLLFTHFEQAPYWALKSLTEHVQQPQVYLKEVLGDIARLVPRGPYQGMWTLKEEFRGGKGGKVEGGEVKAEEDKKPDLGGGHEEDDEDDMEVVS